MSSVSHSVPATDGRATRLERGTLPLMSLPFEWLQMTAFVSRERASVRYLDGVSMLLELALRGLVDVPLARRGHSRRLRSGSNLVVETEPVQNAALDGALVRLRAFDEPDDPVGAAIGLAPYVSALVLTADGPEAGRTRAEGLLFGDEAADIRAALLVWMLKLDVSIGRWMCDSLFPRPGTRAALRALRRAHPEIYGRGDDKASAAAHRVLFALAMAPFVWGTGGC